MKHIGMLAVYVVMTSFSVLLQAQDTVETPLEIQKGKVEALRESIPVPAGFGEARQSGQNVFFTATAKNEKQLLALANRAQSVYRGKKLFGKTVAAFRKLPNHGGATLGWLSRGCKPGEVGPEIGISADRRELSVDVRVSSVCSPEAN